MRSDETINMAGKITAAVILSALMMGMLPVMPLAVEQADTAVSLERIKSVAEAQHEIVVLLIKKKEYEKAAAEANKIFDMKWPDDQEPLLVKELRNLNDKFLSSGQALLGLRLIERNLSRFKRRSSQAALLKEMGYSYKSLGQDEKALDCFKKARDLEAGK
jgi:tetratricopeptide (TPR) repeat protein